MKLALVTVLGMASLALAGGPDYEKWLKDARSSLSDAIDQAMKEAKSGVAVDGEIEEENGKVIWSIAVAQDKKALEVNIDVADNKLVGKPDTENEDHSEVVKAVKITLKDAIKAAVEKVKGSKAVDASFEKEGDKVTAAVVVFADGKVSTVTVDAVTGKVSKVEEGQKGEGGEKDEGDEKKPGK